MGIAPIIEEHPTPSAAPSSDRQELGARTVAAIRTAYTTRFVGAQLQRNPGDFHLLGGAALATAAGDVVVARVTEIGQHTALQSAEGRRQKLFIGQLVLVAYGDRYAPDQFLAHVPLDLGPCQLVAGGGVASRVESMHASIEAATELEPLGLLARDGQVVNLADFAPLQVLTPSAGASAQPARTGVPVIAVLGTSMNSGKSTTLGCLVNGLTNAGLDVAAGKATGTGAGNDPNLFKDAGAVSVADFTDFGYPTTYMVRYEQVRDLLVAMIREQAATGADVVVIEIADGLFQGETSRLLNDPVFSRHVDRVLFSAQDALGALAGEQILLSAGLDLAAVSGRLTASPLAADEARANLRTQVIDTFELCDPQVATALLPRS